LPEPTFRALIEHLPEVEARRHAGVAQLTWLFHDAFSKRKTKVSDWLPAFAVTHGESSRIPSGWRRDLEVGAGGGWLRQELLDAVTAVSERGDRDGEEQHP
jgi:hypothetical protein